MRTSAWKGRVVLITGGSQGLGRVLAEELLILGAEVIIASRDSNRLQECASEIALGDRRPVPVVVDVTDDDSVAGMIGEVSRRFGKLDALFNVAGKSMRGDLASTSLEEQRQLWELNYLGAVRCTLAALPAIQASRGSIVLVGSLASKVAPPFLGAYPASKFPVAAFAQQLRLEEGPDVHVLLVCPGPIARPDAGMRYEHASASIPDSARRPGGGARVRLLDPRDVARRMIRSCERRSSELVLPGYARWLFALGQVSPSWGDVILRWKMGLSR